MNNEQGKMYLIRCNVLKSRAVKWKRIRQFGYQAECWHRHLINLEFQSQESDVRLSAIDLSLFHYEHSDPQKRKRYEELAQVPILSLDERQEAIALNAELVKSYV